MTTENATAIITKIIAENKIDLGKLSLSDLERKVLVKKEELGKLMTIEGATSIVLSELNLFDFSKPQKITILPPRDISEIFIAKDKKTLTDIYTKYLGIIVEYYPTNFFSKKDGTQGCVTNFLVASVQNPDFSVRVTVWQELKKEFFKKGEMIILKNFKVKMNDYYSPAKPELQNGFGYEILYVKGK